MADLPKLDVVIGINFIICRCSSARKRLLRQARRRREDAGGRYRHRHGQCHVCGRAQIGDMSTTTYLKAVHSGEPFKVIGLTERCDTDNCDDP